MTSKFEELAKQATECYSNGDMDYAIWVLEKYLNDSESTHDWVSAKNQYVKNGSICTKCYDVSTKELNELIAD